MSFVAAIRPKGSETDSTGFTTLAALAVLTATNSPDSTARNGRDYASGFSTGLSGKHQRHTEAATAHRQHSENDAEFGTAPVWLGPGLPQPSRRNANHKAGLVGAARMTGSMRVRPAVANVTMLQPHQSESARHCGRARVRSDALITSRTIKGEARLSGSEYRRY